VVVCGCSSQRRPNYSCSRTDDNGSWSDVKGREGDSDGRRPLRRTQVHAACKTESPTMAGCSPESTAPEGSQWCEEGGGGGQGGEVVVLVLFGIACQLGEGKEGYSNALGDKITALIGRARGQERPAAQFGRAAVRTVAKKTLASGKDPQLDKNRMILINCGLLRSPFRLTRGRAMPRRVHLSLWSKICWKAGGVRKD